MKKKYIKIAIIIFSIFIAITGSVIIYDRVTVNNYYYISEKNINIPIFVYHDIIDDNSIVTFDYMQTKKSVFESQIKGLKNIGYDFITYDQLQRFKNNQIKLRKRSCIITFDDGFKGVYENAYPIAKKYNIPITVFIITNMMNEEGRLSWENAREMQNTGLVTIASHSLNHEDFSKLNVNEALENVNNSYKIIEQKLEKNDTKIFTYPYGLHTDEQNITLEKNGYIQNLTDNKINKSKKLDLSRLHRCYPLSDSIYKIIFKIYYRSFRYN